MRKLDTVKRLGGKKIKVRPSLVLILIFFTILYTYGEGPVSSLSTGKRLFMENKPEDAIIWLELALGEDTGNKHIYNFLGIAYEQTGKNQKAIDIYNRGLDYAGNLESQFLTNIANNMVILGNYDSAINLYSKAMISGYNGDALRNRAGEYLRKQLYDEALLDYKEYIAMEVDPYQGEEIKKLINLLEFKLDQIVIQTVEDERKRLEKEARQRDLINQVLNSLSTAGDGTTNLSAGTENVEDYNSDFDIVD